MRKCCGTCKFYEYVDTDKGEEFGWCRRYPPQFFNKDEDHQPFTRPEIWCGEWKKKNVEGRYRTILDVLDDELIDIIPSRLWTIFEREGITSIEHLLQLSEGDFLAMRGIGRLSLYELKSELRKRGLSFRNSEDDDDASKGR